MAIRRFHAFVVAVAATLFTPMAPATSPVPIACSYPALDGLCLLEAAAAADGIQAAYPIGAVVESKHGKWVCTKVIARQFPVATAGVWVEADKK